MLMCILANANPICCTKGVSPPLFFVVLSVWMDCCCFLYPLLPPLPILSRRIPNGGKQFHKKKKNKNKKTNEMKCTNLETLNLNYSKKIFSKDHAPKVHCFHEKSTFFFNVFFLVTVDTWSIQYGRIFRPARNEQNLHKAHF